MGTEMNYGEAYKKLDRHGQLHVLKYYDELTEEEKNEISHRGKALRRMKELLSIHYN